MVVAKSRNGRKIIESPKEFCYHDAFLNLFIVNGTSSFKMLLNAIEITNPKSKPPNKSLK